MMAIPHKWETRKEGMENKTGGGYRLLDRGELQILKDREQRSGREQNCNDSFYTENFRE